MLRYAVRRIIQFIPTVLAITIIMFTLLNVLPGDAALLMGDQRRAKDPVIMAKLRVEMGLDQPIHIRYLKYMANLARGNMGKSFVRRDEVSTLVAERFWPSMKLALTAMALSVLLGIPLGFFSALKQGSWMDTAGMLGAVSGVSIPQFWLGLLLMYFLSVVFPLFPPSGYGSGGLKHLVLPAFSLGIGYTALLARTTRAAVLEVHTMDYIRTARAKGLSELLINRKHVLRNTLILVLTTAGLQFGALIGQTVIVEKLFSWPGLGSLLVDSIFMRDIPVTQGCILLIIVVFLLVNLVVDLLYAWIDPRIEYK
ncbi:MAG: ABC transporter permease [Pseudomonadota bacterium]